MAVHPGSQKKGYVAHFDATLCQACPFYQRGACPAQAGKRDLRFHLRFSSYEQQASVSQRRRRSLAHQRKSRADEASLSNNGAGKEGRNLRAAIEVTVREVKHSFPASKLPVRGRFRVSCMVIGSALVSNARRIQRYLQAKMELENKPKDPQKGTKGSQEPSAGSIFAWLKVAWGGWNTPMMLRKLSLGC